jgi:hypothetical protein
VSDLHRFVGYAIPAGFAVLALWTLYSFVRNRTPASWFWHLLAALQIVIGVQVVVGGILYLSDKRPSTTGPEWLHYVYGGLFPAIVLIVAHRFARRLEGIAWLAFGVAALVNFGLTFRALQTGLGTG